MALEVTTKIESVTLTLDESAARSLLDVLADANLALDDPQLTVLRQELDNLFGGVKRDALGWVDRTPNQTITRRALPSILLSIPRTNKWNVFELRSHIYKYLRDKGFEYLNDPKMIGLSYEANQLALDAAS